MSENISPVAPATAAAETANWRSLINNITETPFYGFFIPKEAIEMVMTEAQKGIRVYLALKTANDISTVHLYVVPTDDAIGVTGDDIIEVNGVSMVYNTTVPCPDLCGRKNILNDNAS